MGPHRGHLLGVEENVDLVVDDGGNLEGADSGEDVVVGVVVVLVGDQLAVDLFFVPGLGHFVHDAVSRGDHLFDGCRTLVKHLDVFGFVVARVPLVSSAMCADFKDKCDFVLVLSHLIKF